MSHLFKLDKNLQYSYNFIKYLQYFPKSVHKHTNNKITNHFKKVDNSKYIITQVYKEAFKAHRKCLINVYHTLFFITPALQSENYDGKSKLKCLFRSNLCH
jgi:hypothetical protein